MRWLAFVLSFWAAMLSASPLGLVEYFRASYQGSNVRLEWQVQSLAAGAEFEIQRQKADEPGFTQLTRVAYTGAQQYVFTDDNLYREQEATAQATISYKLVLRGEGSNGETHFATVEHSPTAVQRSWGSIKMMFR